MALARVGFSSQYFQFGIVYHTVRRQDVLALARVRVDSISQYLPYSFKKDVLDLGLCIIQLRKK